MGFMQNAKAEAVPFALTILLLIVAATYVVRVNHIVRFKSGLDDTETLRRKWSKSDQILFQGFTAPLWLSVIVGCGVALMFVRIISVILDVLDLTHPQDASRTLDLVFWLIGSSVGMAISLFIYSVSGGTLLPLHAVLLIASDVVLYTLHTYSNPHPNKLYLAFFACGLVVFRLCVSYFWAARISSYARNCSGNKLNIEGTGFSHMFYTLKPRLESQGYILIAYALKLVAIKLANSPSNDHSPAPFYFVRASLSFSRLLVLLGCSAASIYTTNTLVMENIDSWQWPSVLTVFILMAVLEAGLAVYRMMFAELSTVFIVYHFLRNVMLSGATGFIASAAYLAVVAKYAHKALDPGADGQTELLDDESEDEDDIDLEFRV